MLCICVWGEGAPGAVSAPSGFSTVAEKLWCILPHQWSIDKGHCNIFASESCEVILKDDLGIFDNFTEVDGAVSLLDIVFCRGIR